MANSGNAALLSKVFGELTFTGDALRRHLPGDVYEKLQQTLRCGSPPDPLIANAVAAAMKAWANGSIVRVSEPAVIVVPPSFGWIVYSASI